MRARVEPIRLRRHGVFLAVTADESRADRPDSLTAWQMPGEARRGDGLGAQRDEQRRGHAEAARPLHPPARGGDRRAQPARLLRAAVGGRVPQVAAEPDPGAHHRLPPERRQDRQEGRHPRGRAAPRDLAASSSSATGRSRSSSRTPAPTGSTTCGSGWRREFDAQLTSLTMLRHPAQVVRSRDAAYLTDMDRSFRQKRETTNVAAWINAAFETERVDARQPARVRPVLRPDRRLARGDDAGRGAARADVQRHQRPSPGRRLHRRQASTAPSPTGRASRSRPPSSTSPTGPGTR